MKSKKCFCLLCWILFGASVSFAQEYNQKEITALKVFFKQLSADKVRTNGAVLGVEDIDNWNPATQTAKLEWNDENTKCVKMILWSGSKLGGSLDLRQLEKIESIECNNNSFTKVLFPEEMTRLTKLFLRKCGLEELVLPKKAPVLSTINCADNSLSTLQLPDNTDGITLIWANNNRLKFSTLPRLKQGELVCSPQDSIYFKEYTGTVDLSSEYAVETDKITTFKWFIVDENGDKTLLNSEDYTMDQGLFVFQGDLVNKRLICEMSNSYFPDLQLMASVTPKVQKYALEDMENIKTFLRQPSKREGLTNADVLKVTDVDHWNPDEEPADLIWNDEMPKRLAQVVWVLKDVAGTLDLSGCKYIQRVETNITGIKEIILPEDAPQLSTVYCPQSDMTKLILPKNAPSFSVLNCYLNQLEELVLPEVVGDKFEVRANNNNITSFIVPEGIKNQLYLLWLHENKLREIQMPDALPQLRYLYLRNNKLTACELPDDPSALEYFWIEKNEMKFSSLPAVQPTGVYTYAPQDTIDLNDGGKNEIDLSGEYSVSRNGIVKTTVYQWYEIENGTEKEINNNQYTNNMGVFTFQIDIANKSLICRMKNENFPDLIQVCSVNRFLTSIDSTKAKSDLNLYPNPARGWVNIDLSGYEGKIETLAIFDLAGNKIRQEIVTDKVVSISLEGLAPGCYLVRVNAGGKECVNRLIVR